jgi:hypothetical protein
MTKLFSFLFPAVLPLLLSSILSLPTTPSPQELRHRQELMVPNLFQLKLKPPTTSLPSPRSAIARLLMKLVQAAENAETDVQP